MVNKINQLLTMGWTYNDYKWYLKQRIPNKINPNIYTYCFKLHLYQHLKTLIIYKLINTLSHIQLQELNKNIYIRLKKGE